MYVWAFSLPPCNWWFCPWLSSLGFSTDSESTVCRGLNFNINISVRELKAVRLACQVLLQQIKWKTLSSDRQHISNVLPQQIGRSPLFSTLSRGKSALGVLRCQLDRSRSFFTYQAPKPSGRPPERIVWVTMNGLFARMWSDTSFNGGGLPK